MERETIPRRNDSVTEQHASTMRHAPTRSEEALWRALSCKLLGVSLRRQVVIDLRIADFGAPSMKLVVEVDGGYHRERGWLEAHRDDALRRADYHVLHLPTEVVLGDSWQAVALIRAALCEGACADRGAVGAPSQGAPAGARSSPCTLGPPGGADDVAPA